jgi:hypothetical protein
MYKTKDGSQYRLNLSKLSYTSEQISETTTCGIMPTLRHLLQNRPWEGALNITDQAVSVKPKAETLPLLLKYVHVNPNADVVFPEREDDTSRLSAIFPDIPLLRQTIHNEGDVRRVFAELSKHVEYSFSGMPNTALWPRLVQRWEAGPPGTNVTTTETIDLWFGLKMTDSGQMRCAAIGELKRPGTLQEAGWMGTPDTDGRRLARQIRMYVFTMLLNKPSNDHPGMLSSINVLRRSTSTVLLWLSCNLELETNTISVKPIALLILAIFGT